MRALSSSEVAKLLHEFGQRTALRGGNPYRARAYTRAAENLLTLAEPLEDIVAQNRLREIPGVGDAIADIVTKLHRTGRHPALDEMRTEIPAGTLELLTVPGLRPDKALKNVKGVGAVLQTKILQGIEIKRRGEGQRHLHRAAALLELAQAQLLRSRPGVSRITPAGDFRRGCELIGDLSLVAQVSDLHGAVRKHEDQSQLALNLTDKQHYGAVLLLATGSQEHLKELRAIAAARSMTLDKDGLRKGDKIIASKSEEEIYRALGLQFIEPELREGRGEVTLAQKGKLPALVTDADLRGILHAHTDRSDGVDTLEAMAEATRERGYSYFGVADHSRTAHYAGGLSLEEIAAQHAEVDQLNRRYGKRFRIFKGIESDILVDGSLDYPDEVLAQFDFVVASVHGRFKLDRKGQTERIIRAVSNPHTTILGHMTGRQLLRRPGYEVDIERILSACAKHGVAVEINANPWRLDLDWRWHQRAIELGCLMSINPDAHSTDEIDLTHWGVEMARKGGVPKERVLNCLDLAAFAALLKERTPGRTRRRR